jgi:hypothetical protein
MVKVSSIILSSEDEIIQSLRGLQSFEKSVCKENTSMLILKVEEHLDKIDIAIAESKQLQARLEKIVANSLAQIEKMFKLLEKVA